MKRALIQFVKWCGLSVVLALVMSTSAHAKVYYSKEGALRLAFPTATRVEPKHIFLTDEQVRDIEKSSGEAPQSKIVTAYQGYRDQTLLGHAFIDSHIVRTLPETFMTVIDPQGKVVAIHVLAFNEPEEYLPPAAWLKQFDRHALSPNLQVRRDIAGIAGATLSANAITQATRRILATHRIVFSPPSELEALPKVAVSGP